jgi:hypothetical protein
MTTADDSKIRAETAAGIKTVIQGLDGQGWALACVANPHITLPPGAGYLIVKHYSQVLIESAERMTQVTGFLGGTV